MIPKFKNQIMKTLTKLLILIIISGCTYNLHVYPTYEKPVISHEYQYKAEPYTTPFYFGYMDSLINRTPYKDRLKEAGRQARIKTDSALRFEINELYKDTVLFWEIYKRN